MVESTMSSSLIFSIPSHVNEFKYEQQLTHNLSADTTHRHAHESFYTYA